MSLSTCWANFSGRYGLCCTPELTDLLYFPGSSQSLSLPSRCPADPSCCCHPPADVQQAALKQIKILSLATFTSCPTVGLLLNTGGAFIKYGCVLNRKRAKLCMSAGAGWFCSPDAFATLLLSVSACSDSVPWARNVKSVYYDVLNELLLKYSWSSMSRAPWNIFALWAASRHGAACFEPKTSDAVATAVLDGLGSSDCFSRVVAFATLAAAEHGTESMGRLLDAAQQQATQCPTDLAQKFESHLGKPMPILRALAHASCKRLLDEVRGDSSAQFGGVSALLLGTDEYIERIRLRSAFFESVYRLRIWSKFPGMEIYGADKDEWTRSGGGSTHKDTRPFRRYLSKWTQRFEVSSLLDIGCGDGSWQFLLEGVGNKIRYLGIDVSAFAIASARKRYENSLLLGERFNFLHYDPVLGIPSSGVSSAWDLALVEDVLQHLPNREILQLFGEIKKSGTRLLAASHHFTRNFSAQRDPSKLGRPRYTTEPSSGMAERRTLDLYREPFLLPEPLAEYKYAQRTLSLWLVSELPDFGAALLEVSNKKERDVHDTETRIHPWRNGSYDADPERMKFTEPLLTAASPEQSSLIQEVAKEVRDMFMNVSKSFAEFGKHMGKRFGAIEEKVNMTVKGSRRESSFGSVDFF